MYKITDRDLQNIRNRFWAEKARQEREDMNRVPLVETFKAKNGGIWL